jgi:eukaryotic-like serine/threonine-protein kinase
MQLWTDYEGVTLDGAFPLQKLLMPEGRSAFFSTASPKGEPTVVRLIECHFDEEEILDRWRCVEALNQPNFLKFEHFGQTELDGRPVVYAVLEKVDANLAEVLDRGHLTFEDVGQLASSLVAALDVLHTHGFIHEHIEPRNIFAISGVVKLRSDCIREAPEGEEGRAAKRRDVRDLATVLLRGLTQRESVEGIPDSAMPPPFGQIIRNGLSGTWGLENIRAALGDQFNSKQPTAPKSVKAAPATTAVPEQKAPGAAAKPSMRPEAQLPLPLLKEDRNAGFAGATTRKDTWGRNDSWGDAQSFSLRSRWLGAGIAALLLLLFTWVLAHGWDAHRHKAAQAAAVSQLAAQPAVQPAVQSAKQISISPAPQPVAADVPGVSLPAAAGSRADWRVITFTYNRRADAEKKASDLAHSHPELEPVVFTPSGHAPFLVSIGGVMDRDAAHALARRSRSLGLPHDMYAQNYSR